MSNFEFISNDTFRTMLERDKCEMESCLKAGNHKSVLILAGSIIEAVLVDFFLVFLSDNETEKTILKSPLHKLINMAVDENLISERTKDISTVVRNYRNLIHPGKEFRLKERVDKHSANVAANLVEIIIDELRDEFSKKFGYKADAVVAKVRIDPSCGAIFEHMVEQMVPSERLKLFCSIPTVCKDEDIEDNLLNFMKLHGILAQSIPQEVIRKQTERLNDFLKHRSMEDTLRYLSFYINHLSLLNDEDKDAVLAYVIELLGSGNQYVLMDIKRMNPYTIGRYIDEKKKKNLLLNAIMKRLWLEEATGDDIFLAILEGIFTNLPGDVIENIKNRIGTYPASKSEKWIEKMNEFIPF